MKILVIDDSADARTIIGEMLKRAGYEIIETDSGKQGIKLIAKNKPDLVITDILMPEMDGIEFVRTIARIYPKLPVIAITGSLYTPYLTAAQKMGAVTGLHKPFTREELVSAIRQALGE